MNTGNEESKHKCFMCKEQISYYTGYAKDLDITFVMKDRLINDEPITSEVVGWYHGVPEKGYTEAQIESYLNEGQSNLIARLEPEEYKVKEVK